MRKLGRMLRILIDSMTASGLIIGAVAILIVTIFLADFLTTKKPVQHEAQTTTQIAAQEEKVDAQIAGQEAAMAKVDTEKHDGEEQESTRRGAVMYVAAQLRDSMRNPDSLVIEGAWANDNGSVVCFLYRAQNGFGGMDRAGAYARKGVLHTDVDGSIYNPLCGSKSPPKHDMLSAAQTAVKYPALYP